MPSAPVSPTADLTATSTTQVSFTWSASLSDGNEPIIDYKVYMVVGASETQFATILVSEPLEFTWSGGGVVAG